MTGQATSLGGVPSAGPRGYPTGLREAVCGMWDTSVTSKICTQIELYRAAVDPYPDDQSSTGQRAYLRSADAIGRLHVVRIVVGEIRVGISLRSCLRSVENHGRRRVPNTPRGGLPGLSDRQHTDLYRMSLPTLERRLVFHCCRLFLIAQMPRSQNLRDVP